MNSTRSYNENYYTSRKKILNDFLKDEEEENMKYIEETERLVSQTKMFLKDLISGQVYFEQLNDQLEDIQAELESDCNIMEGEILTLQAVDKQIENQTIEIQRQEEQSTKNYLNHIEELKAELESKEFTIQNMERLYIELENVIKKNISKGSEQLLTMDQFNDFVSQNDKLKAQVKLLEDEKDKLNKDYNNLLKENLNLRSKDESFELEKIKDVLNELSLHTPGNKHAEQQINELQEKYKALIKENTDLTEKIQTLTNKLKAINIDNPIFDNELNQIDKELKSASNDKKLNKSFSENYKVEDNINKYIKTKDKDNAKHLHGQTGLC